MNLVFDFGAVLFSWQPVHLVQANLQSHAATTEEATLLAQAIFSHDDWLDFDRGRSTLDEAIASIAARLDLPAAQLDSMLSPVGERMAPIAETVALLARLRERRDRDGSLRLYYLSNMPSPYARQLEARHEFLRWFDGGVFSGDVQAIKPEERIYRLLAERHALEPARTVFIDDMAGNVQAARELGWHGIHFQTSAALAQQLKGHGLLS
jgi:putative hydrolase of the HAD superfamily